MICKWDSDAGTYLVDDEPCRKDEFGLPTKHCTARRTCSNHIGLEELTCARCLHRTRTDLRTIVVRYAELMPEAMELGSVETTAAWMAGPVAHSESWMWRQSTRKQRILERFPDDLGDDPQIIARNQKPTDPPIRKINDETWEANCNHDGGQVWVIQRGTEHLAQRSLYAHRRECLAYALNTEMDPDDDQHPVSVLGVWSLMIAEDYGLDLPDPLTLHSGADFLDRLLNRVAQDDGQDFPLLARELRKCRSHLESVLRDSQSPERGAPCPTCKDAENFVRLVREYAHWCESETCEQFHLLTDEADIWVCPRNKDHWWTVVGFAEEQRERQSA